MNRPRVLLVEDDASIRRFIGMAFEDQALDIVNAPGLASAIEALRGPPFALVLCDLMLPDGRGLDLLRALAGSDSPSPHAHRVAFSAGVPAAMRLQLQQAGVHEVLRKPASLAELQACVARALAPRTAGTAASPNAATAASAALNFFGGDVALFQAFLAKCRPQFRLDAAAGDLAAERQDLQALRRLAHSVKSALLILGFETDSLLAARVEAAAAGQHGDEAWCLWPALRARLLVQSGLPPDAMGIGAPSGRA